VSDPLHALTLWLRDHDNGSIPWADLGVAYELVEMVREGLEEETGEVYEELCGG
jgi:hypothetical protein